MKPLPPRTDSSATRWRCDYTTPGFEHPDSEHHHDDEETNPVDQPH